MFVMLQTIECSNQSPGSFGQYTGSFCQPVTKHFNCDEISVVFTSDNTTEKKGFQLTYSTGKLLFI